MQVSAHSLNTLHRFKVEFNEIARVNNLRNIYIFGKIYKHCKQLLHRVQMSYTVVKAEIHDQYRLTYTIASHVQLSKSLAQIQKYKSTISDFVALKKQQILNGNTKSSFENESKFLPQNAKTFEGYEK